MRINLLSFIFYLILRIENIKIGLYCFDDVMYKQKQYHVVKFILKDFSNKSRHKIFKNY